MKTSGISLQKRSGVSRGLAVKAFSMTLLASSLYFAAPTTTEAYTKCVLTAECVTQGEKTRSHFSSRISQMESSLVAEIRNAVERIIGALRESTAATTTSHAKNTADAGENLQKVEQAAMGFEAMQDIATTRCGATSGAQGGRSGGMGSGGASVGKHRPQNTNLSEYTEAAISAGVAQVNPVENSRKVQASAGIGACVDFADPSSLSGKLCSWVTGQSGSGKSPYKNADIDPSTLFKGPDSLKNANSVLSVPKDGPEAGARQAHLNMLFEANPAEVITEDQANTLGSQDFIGLYRHYRASKELASYGAKLFNELSTIDPKTKPALDALRVEDAAFVNEFFKGVDSKYYAEGVSPLALMELQVESRIGNKEWFKRLSTIQDAEREAEKLAMQALALRIQYQQLLAQHHTNVVLGKVLDTQVEATIRPLVDHAAQKVTETQSRHNADGAPSGGGATEGP